MNDPEEPQLGRDLLITFLFLLVLFATFGLLSRLMGIAGASSRSLAHFS